MSTNSSVPDGNTKHAGPEPFLARTLSASLTVRDLQKSLAWYQDVVGFTSTENMSATEAESGGAESRGRAALDRSG
jgi:Glyoxalase/Bleomycin resistance protein/Dioxygenase superfamily